jgi:uncharacterized protein YbjT (DUF2867 family)
VIVVAGGTGRLGSSLVRQLLARGADVRVFARGLSGEAPTGVDVVRGDIRSGADVERAVVGADVVVSAVQGFAGPGRVTPRSVDRDGNINLIRAAERADADVVLVSLTHAAPDSPLEIAREKYAAEQALRASASGWTVVRSAAFAELWIHVLEQTAGRSHRPVVFGRGQTPMWWVSTEDVATEVARVTLDRSTRGRTVGVVGPQGLSLEELARKVMLAHGWSGSPRRVGPVALRLGSATIGRLAPTMGRQLSAALAMDHLPAETPEAIRAATGRRTVDHLLEAARSN